VPLDWALMQMNLGNALLHLGERESETTRLEEAVAAYRAALEEPTRDRVFRDSSDGRSATRTDGRSDWLMVGYPTLG
jgi:hypothetical protein